MSNNLIIAMSVVASAFIPVGWTLVQWLNSGYKIKCDVISTKIIEEKLVVKVLVRNQSLWPNTIYSVSLTKNGQLSENDAISEQPELYLRPFEAKFITYSFNNVPKKASNLYFHSLGSKTFKRPINIV